MKKLLAYIKIICYGFEHLSIFTLGDKVIYQRKEYILNQGVAKPFWDLLEENNSELIHVHQSKFKKKPCWYNVKHAFEFAYRFYKGYWFDIWTKNWSTMEMLRFTLKNDKWFKFGKV